MASSEADLETKAGKKGYTAPKGRPTTHSTGEARGNRISPMMEWLLAGIVFIAVLAAIFYFGRGLNTPGGGGHSGLEAPTPIILIDGNV